MVRSVSNGHLEYAGYPGSRWQDLCLKVLRHHHGPLFVHIPDTGGDKGLEGFSLDGSAYQCYSPEGERLPTKRRYQKHRDKVTVDVGKFLTNATAIGSYVPAGTLISFWILLVPYADNKEIIRHCKEQTDRIRAAVLPFCSPDIAVMVKTLADYAVAHKQIIEQTLATLSLPLPLPPDYSTVASTQVDTMRGKLARISAYEHSPIRLADVVSKFLADHIAAKDHRSYLLDQYTELGERLDAELSDLQRRLELGFMLTLEQPEQLLAGVLAAAEERVLAAVPGLSSDNARVLAYGQVAEWLLLCPLELGAAT